tara:strand:+ start:532 stop:738 length:207 start_codon:yes stop_codon:yes gene_type:complete
MTKRLVDIDDTLLEEAREALGTATMKATVNGALRRAVDLELARRHAIRLMTMEGMDLEDPEVMKDAWR